MGYGGEKLFIKMRNERSDEHHKIQRAVVKFARDACHAYPELLSLYAIPNGEKRDKIAAAKLKAEGVLAGVWDLHLPVPCGGFCGLWIEIKHGKDTLSTSQQQWGKCVRHYGHATCIAYTAQEAIDSIMEYINCIWRRW
jgi:hypothetical protein